MHLNRSRLGALAIALASLSYAFQPGTASATPHDPDHNVTTCHRTNSDTNPYVKITVDEAAVDGKGGGDHYGEHKGPIWNPNLKAQKIEWGDIIPAVFPHHLGQNWSSEGKSIFNNGCVVPASSTTTTRPTTTTTAPKTTTTVHVTTTVPKVSTTVPNVTITTPKGTSSPSPDTITRPEHPSELANTGIPVWAYVMVALGLIGLGLLPLRLRRNG